MSPPNLALRGVPLVEKVIAAIEAQGGVIDVFCTPRTPPISMPAAILETLTFPGGKPLPPSLKRWLAYDCAWLGLNQAAPNFNLRSLSALVRDEFDALWGDLFQGFEAVLPEPCFLLHGGSDSRRFLYVGEPDSWGEYPVLVLDTDDLPFVCIYNPGFDVWLAEEFGVLDFEREYYESMFDYAPYQAAMREQAFRNVDGFKTLGDFDEERLPPPYPAWFTPRWPEGNFFQSE